MNNKNLLIASLIGAVVTTFFANFPILNFINCLVCLPFWGGPLLAVWYYKRQTGTMTMNQAITVGLVAGLLAGVFGFLLSFIGMAGAAGLVYQLNQYMPEDSIPTFLVSGTTALLFTLAGVITNIFFGLIGGLIGGAIFQDKAPVAPSLNQ